MNAPHAIANRPRLKLRATCAVLFAAAGVAFATTAPAQSYPARPVRVIVPYPPGGPSDVMTRLIAEQLGAAFGQPFVVENKSGADGDIGLREAARAAPDGYTLAQSGAGAFSIKPHIALDMPWDPERDFMPVNIYAVVPYVLVSNPALPVQSLKELLAWIRSKQGKANAAVASTTSAVALAMFRKMNALEFADVPYQGDAQAMTAVIGGQIDFYISASQQIGALTRSGKVRALAVPSTHRSSVVPDVPTFAEAGMEKFFDSTAWLGLITSAAAPAEIVARLNREANRIAFTPAFRERLMQAGMSNTTRPMTATETRDFMRADRQRWGQAVKESGAKLP